MADVAHTPGGVRRRRRHRAWLTVGPQRNRGRFFLIAVGLLALAFVAVPPLTELVESLLHWDDLTYNPRDFVRTKWINVRGVTDIFTGAEGLLTVAFLFLCVLFYMRSRR